MTLPVLPPQQIDVFLDVLPRPKGRPRFVRATGRAYTDAATREFETTVRDGFRDWADTYGWEPLPTPVYAWMEFTFPPPQKPKWWAPASKGKSTQGAADLDNYIKAVADAGNGILWLDDVQIVSQLATKRYGEAGLRLRAWEQLSD